MKLDVVHRIACEQHNSALVRIQPRNAVQGVRLKQVYELFLVLRILLTLNLQMGWIHSEEFQSLEIITGDYFDLQVHKSAAFNSTFPTRSIVFPHLTVYIPYILTHRFLSNSHPIIQEESVPNPEALILVPRLAHVLLSFALDLILIKFFSLQDRKPRRKVPEEDDLELDPTPDLKPNTYGQYSRLVTLASSQIVLVFTSRTHAALLNTIFFGILLCLVSDSMHYMDEYLPILNEFHAINIQKGVTKNETTPKVKSVPQKKPKPTVSSTKARNGAGVKRKSYENDSLSHENGDHKDHVVPGHEKSDPLEKDRQKTEDHMEKIRQKVKLLKELKSFRYNPIHNLHWIALTIVFGIFNDPDFFLSFGSVPIFFYLQRGISNSHIGMTQFHLRLFIFIAYFCGMSIPFILWDSFYHRRVSLQDLNDLNLNSSSFVITPVNYFVTKSSSIRKFETIPWISVNFLTMFNVLGLLGMLSISREIYALLFQNWKYKPRLSSQWTFLNCSWFIPLMAMVQYKSTFDLAPLIFPLVILHGHKIPIVSRFSWKLGLSWFGFNLVAVCFWGYLNQSGLLSSFLEFNAAYLPQRFNDTHVDILLAQMTSIPPIFVLSIPSTWKTILTSKHLVPELDLDRDKVNNDFQFVKYVHDLPKTVLRMELDKKVRVFSIAESPLPLCHFESEMLRIMDRKSRRVVKVNLVIIPREATFDERSLNCFRKSRLTLLKTYWNHWQLKWPFLETGVTVNGSSKLARLVWRDFIPQASQGLNLYRFEDNRYRTMNDTEFETILNFSNETLSTCLIHWALFTFTTFLFLMSFITFAM